MRNVLSTVVALTWALWFGGMIALFVFIFALFSTDRSIALEAAPRLFVTFGLYQLIVGIVALVAATTWRLIEPRRVLTGIVILFTLAAIGAILLSMVIVRPMERLRASGQRESAQFKQLHSQSTKLYLAEAVALLVAGCMLPSAIRATPSADRAGNADSEPAAASALPGAGADQATAT